jgi:hypothetical protein
MGRNNADGDTHLHAPGQLRQTCALMLAGGSRRMAAAGRAGPAAAWGQKLCETVFDFFFTSVVV